MTTSQFTSARLDDKGKAPCLLALAKQLDAVERHLDRLVLRVRDCDAAAELILSLNLVGFVADQLRIHSRKLNKSRPNQFVNAHLQRPIMPLMLYSQCCFRRVSGVFRVWACDC